jgi:hypothetical protein
VKVRDIRRRVARGELQSSVAQRYAISQSAVSNIVRRKVWTHV